ncbi:hypothetical protein Lal_00014684 [Lupinus albus]|nr:hypothetical protein Lal_00014684 [Lupinus albus]
MNNQFWLPEYPTFQPGWDLENFHATFFKCISWQVEETLDSINCPYHYVCDRTYPSNYPPSVDILVLLFTIASYLVTLVIVIMDMMNSRKERKVLYIKNLMEKSSWVLITVDCVYLIVNSPQERVMLRVAAFGGIFLLICLHVLKESYIQICTMACASEKLRWAATSLQTIKGDSVHETHT